jgi:hypothetical protein
MQRVMNNSAQRTRPSHSFGRDGDRASSGSFLMPNKIISFSRQKFVDEAEILCSMKVQFTRTFRPRLMIQSDLCGTSKFFNFLITYLRGQTYVRLSQP